MLQQLPERLLLHFLNWMYHSMLVCKVQKWGWESYEDRSRPETCRQLSFMSNSWKNPSNTVRLCKRTRFIFYNHFTPKFDWQSFKKWINGFLINWKIHKLNVLKLSGKESSSDSNTSKSRIWWLGTMKSPRSLK